MDYYMEFYHVHDISMNEYRKEGISPLDSISKYRNTSGYGYAGIYDLEFDSMENRGIFTLEILFDSLYGVKYFMHKNL